MNKNTPLTIKERIYLQHLLGREVSEVFLEDVSLSTDEAETFSSAQQKMNEDYPLDYLIGSVYIPELEVSLSVNESTLIPREETIAWLQRIIQTNLIPQKYVVMDVGTGSGLIAIALAKLGYSVIATDVFDSTLSTAQSNNQLNKTHITFYNSNLLDNPNIFEQIQDAPWALISNLPYVPQGDITQESFKTIKFEPQEAIFSGEDGLDLATKLLTQIHNLAHQPNIIVLELDPRNIEKAQKLLPDHYSSEISLDHNNHKRVLIAKKN